KLGGAVAKILRGEEGVVPAMVGDNRQDLLQRRAKVQDLRASLTILGNNSKPKSGDKKPAEKKPGEKKPEPGEKKPGVRTPDLVGTVGALSAAGKRFTLRPAPTVKNREPAAIDIQSNKGTTITAGRLGVGQAVSVWLAKGDAKLAATVRIGERR